MGMEEESRLRSSDSISGMGRAGEGWNGRRKIRLFVSNRDGGTRECKVGKAGTSIGPASLGKLESDDEALSFFFGPCLCVCRVGLAERESNTRACVCVWFWF